jgi:tetratricopeptide (TPR) repeat protein
MSVASNALRHPDDANREMPVLRQRLILLALAIAACACKPVADPPDEPGSASAAAQTHRIEEHPLVRILVQADGALPGEGENSAWITEEVRYLLARQGVVRLAHPDGPHDPGSGEHVHTLAIEIPEADSLRPMRIAFQAPDGRLIDYESLERRPQSRLELIEGIANALGAMTAPAGSEVSLATLIGTHDADLYDEYTRTQVAHLRAVRRGERDGLQLESPNRRLERFERMTRRDPDFARGWSALALAYLELRGKDEDALAKLADDAARRALALDPQLPEAEAALGRTRYRYGQWLEAEDHLIAALAADPAAPTALEAYTCFLLDLGRIAYARQVGAQALGTVPGSDDARECLAIAELAAGETGRAQETLGPDDDPEPVGITRARALVDLASADYESARIALAAVSKRTRQSGVWLDPVMSAVTGSASRPAAMRALTRAVDVGRLDVVTETMLGAELLQPDFVFNRLLRMRAQRQAVPLRLLWLPDSRYLREHPRFPDVIDQLGLRTYWNQRSRPDHCRTEPRTAGCF